MKVKRIMEGEVISIKLQVVYLFDDCDSENLLDDSDQQGADTKHRLYC